MVYRKPFFYCMEKDETKNNHWQAWPEETISFPQSIKLVNFLYFS